MKKLSLLFVPAVTLAVLFTSCKKTENANPANNTGPTPVSPTPGNVNGALVSLQMDYSYTNPNIPIPVTVTSEIGLSVFFTSPGATTYYDAGAVSVNSNNLDKANNNSYTKLATVGQTPSDMGFSGGSNWTVGGSGNVAAFSYNHTAAFPDYSGTLPTSVTKSAGLTISLSGNVSNADSVYVLLAAGNQSILKHVAASAASVSFTPNELAAFPNITDNTGIVEVDPFNMQIRDISGKTYAFIKEKAVVGNVNIN